MKARLFLQRSIKGTPEITIKSGIRTLAGIVLALTTFWVPRGTANAQAVTPVAKLDLNQITGAWYEIARYPVKREKKCLGNVMMLVALGDKTNHIQLVNTCKIKAGYTDAINTDGKTQDKSGDGKLKLGSIWPFYRKFWVLAVGPQNAWMLVGKPSRKELWIYARTPSIAADVLAQVEAKAVSEGFDTARLTTTVQGLRAAN